MKAFFSFSATRDESQINLYNSYNLYTKQGSPKNICQVAKSGTMKHFKEKKKNTN